MLLKRWVVSRVATLAVNCAVRSRAVLLAAILVGLVPLGAGRADACPFCAAVSLTFCEEIAGADVAVIAKLVTPAPPVSAGNPGDIAKARFEVVERLKGDKSLAVGKKFEALYFGESPVGSLMLITGVDPANINWSLPIAITPKARHYLTQALKLPKEGPDRLVFFQDYLEDEDELLARDAYDEFAKTPYAGVKDLKGRISHDKLIGWIQDPKVAPSRRRLYLTMVGVCGQPQDAALLEKMIRSDDRQVKSGLDALIAAYLTLKGPDGMPLIEDLFLKKKDADYTETYSAIMALRFHGQEEQAIPRPRLLEALHYMLDRPQLADLVIADLARWQDWAIMDRLVELFKNATDETSWVRVPVINYLQACPLPKAKEYLVELAKLDPESVKKATNLFPIGATAPAARDKSPAASSDAKPAGGSDQDASKQDAAKPDAAKKDAAQKDGAKDDSAVGAGADAGSAAKTDPNNSDERANAGQTGATPPGVAQPGDKAAADSSAGRTPSSGTRLSRAPAPGVSASAPVVGAPRLLAWMALASCLLGASFWAILGGGRKSSS